MGEAVDTPTEAAATLIEEAAAVSKDSTSALETMKPPRTKTLHSIMKSLNSMEHMVPMQTQMLTILSQLSITAQKSKRTTWTTRELQLLKTKISKSEMIKQLTTAKREKRIEVPEES